MCMPLSFEIQGMSLRLVGLGRGVLQAIWAKYHHPEEYFGLCQCTSRGPLPKKSKNASRQSKVQVLCNMVESMTADCITS
jgi:hypothetical protein